MVSGVALLVLAAACGQGADTDSSRVGGLGAGATVQTTTDAAVQTSATLPSTVPPLPGRDAPPATLPPVSNVSTLPNGFSMTLQPDGLPGRRPATASYLGAEGRARLASETRLAGWVTSPSVFAATPSMFERLALDRASGGADAYVGTAQVLPSGQTKVILVSWCSESHCLRLSVSEEAKRDVQQLCKEQPAGYEVKIATIAIHGAGGCTVQTVDPSIARQNKNEIYWSDGSLLFVLTDDPGRLTIDQLVAIAGEAFIKV